MFTTKSVIYLQILIPVLVFTADHNQQYILINYLHSHVAKHAHLPNYIHSGPKLEEVAIFWQMVMEQKPAVVVMLTKVEENGKVTSLYMYTTTNIILHYCICRPHRTACNLLTFMVLCINFILDNNNTIIIFKMNLKYAHTTQ